MTSTTGDFETAGSVIADTRVETPFVTPDVFSDTAIGLTADTMTVYVDDVLMLALTNDTQDLVQIGATSGDIDIKLNDSAIFVEGSSGNIGIGCTPSELFVVGDDPGNIHADPVVFVVSDDDHDSHCMVGQSGTAGLTWSWQYNDTPVEDTYAEGFINTFGHANDINMDAKELAFNALSGGNMGLGIADPAYPVDVFTSTTGYAVNIFNDGNNISNYGLRIQCGLDNNTANNTQFVGFYDGDASDLQGGIVGVSGGIGWGVVSDRKIKKDITTSTIDGLDILSKMRVAKFRIGDGSLQDGFIAQELESVLPSAATTLTYTVMATADDRDKEGYTTRTVATQVIHEIQKSRMVIFPMKIIPPLVKAVQQQQKQIKANTAEIKTMQADIVRLENLIKSYHPQEPK